LDTKEQQKLLETVSTQKMLNEYHESLLHLPIENGVIKTDIEGWLQPAEAHYLYECAYKSNNILELGCYHGLSTTIMTRAIYDAGNEGTMTTLDVFEENINETKKNIQKYTPDVKVNYKIADAINFILTDDSKYDLIFIDANHTYNWMKVLTHKLSPISQGKIVFHDFFHKSTGVQTAVEEVLGLATHKVGSIGVYE